MAYKKRARGDFPHVDASLERIQKQKEWLLDTTIKLWSANSDMYLGHLVYAALVDRTLSNIHGFTSMIEAKNFLCASSVLRQQIDTAMRANAYNLVSDKNELSKKIMEGTKFYKIKDKEGNEMRDAFLRRELATRYPWINDVYEETSGAVHLSEKHIFSSIADVKENGVVTLELSGLTSKPYEDLAEIVACFAHCVEVTYEVMFSEDRSS